MKGLEHTLDNKQLLNSLLDTYNQGLKLTTSKKYEDIVKALPYFLDALSLSEKLHDDQDNTYTAQALWGVSYAYRGVVE